MPAAEKWLEPAVPAWETGFIEGAMAAIRDA